MDEEDNQKTYRIVGPDEFNVSEGKLSVDLPLARALLKKQRDDEVTIQTVNGEEIYWVEKTWYE